MNPKHFRYTAWIAALLMVSQISGRAIPQQSPMHLMPIPERIVKIPGRLPVNPAFGIHISGYRNARLRAAVVRTMERLRHKTGIPLACAPVETSDPDQRGLEIHCSGAGEKIQSMQADESYILEVTPRKARLSAPSPIGILRGLETFLQLVDLDCESFFAPCVKIEDRPRFRWRGLLIDVSRHWQPVDVIKRNLDAMAALKMNVLHWHLSDDQGFRVESRVFPRLHQVGSGGLYYTQNDVREIVAYALDRGIRVIPEFDMPGHTTAWLAACPELASAPGPYRIKHSWGVHDPCMDPTQKKLYTFLDSFIGEMALLFPDAYFHIGGDEVSGKHWNANSKIRAFKARQDLVNNHDLQAYFNRRLLKILKKHGKTMIGWDEVLHPELPNAVAVQSWRSLSAFADSARRGHSAILSYGYYLDHMQTAAVHYAIDPFSGESANLTENEKERILGGEACMWGEFVTPDNIESRIWPRTAAIAERLWSPREVRDVPDLYRRLKYVDRELDGIGLKHRINYVTMLQRMAGNCDIAPLQTLAELLQPAALGIRARTRKYSSNTPLNRMVDTIMPESAAARHFGDLLEKALAGPDESNEAFREIRKQLIFWHDNKDAVERIIERSFLLREIAPLSEAVFQLIATGLQALEYLEFRRKPPKAWKTETALLLEGFEKPQAEIIVAIYPAVKKLTEAANAIP
jgi:hexosaminidase